MKKINARNPDRASRIKVLVIEDDACLEPVLTGTLQAIDRNVEVYWTDSALEALMAIDAAKRDKVEGFDLVVSDIFLPGDITGLDLWRACYEHYPETPFLLTSGMSVDRFLRSIPDNMSAPAYLAKPFYAGECRQLVEGLLAYSPHGKLAKAS
jgi:DNA-binding NtrC family response regulator